MYIIAPNLSKSKARVAPKFAKTEKATLISERGLYLCRQLPTLPHTFACSTIGPAGLNFRVRDGNGWNPRGKITDKSEQRSLAFGRLSLAKDLAANLVVPANSRSFASLRMTSLRKIDVPES